MKKWKKNGNENGEEEEFWEFWKESWKAEICIVTFRFFRILVNCKESPTPKKRILSQVQVTGQSGRHQIN